jgi:hypothetical protein
MVSVGFTEHRLTAQTLSDGYYILLLKTHLRVTSYPHHALRPLFRHDLELHYFHRRSNISTGVDVVNFVMAASSQLEWLWRVLFSDSSVVFCC